MIVPAPAAAKASTWRSGRSTMRWTSRWAPRSRSAAQAFGPMVRGGTKYPSMTSTCRTVAPAARIDGATRGSGSGTARSDLDEHGAAAVVADGRRGARHADDRAVLAAV